MRSARRDTTAGRTDKLGGRILELLGKLTGKRSANASGKAARVRGTGRTAKGRAKSRTEKGRAKRRAEKGRAAKGRARRGRRR
jgi:uncharacterized protein YjbJ (UPF0337 family)